MTYEQRTGAIRYDNGKLIGIGYSGHGLGKNNPLMQDVKNVGPIPRGRYKKGKVYDSEHTGPFTILLIPDLKNEMFGRSDFKMHGDSIENPGTASLGCIVAERETREEVYNSTEQYINVI